MTYNYNKILKRILDIGEQMVVFGAEVSRVENSIERMCEAYGVKHTDIFIITSSMVVTIETYEGEIITQTRRIRNLANDYDKLDYLNDLSRRICQEKPQDDQIEKMFDQVLARPNLKRWQLYLAGVLVTAGFTMFFGGVLIDGVASVLTGLLIMFVILNFKKPDTKEVPFYIALSFLAGIVAVFFKSIGLGENIDMMMMGNIMILIPGAAMTNAIKDMVLGDIISGLLRLAQSLIIAVCLAVGFGMALLTIGGSIL